MHILVHKAFTSALQRLFLYLVLATLVQEALIGLSFEHQFQYPGQTELCTGYGFIIQWSGVVMFNFALGLMLYVLYLVYIQIKQEPFTQLRRTRYGKRLVECVYLIFILTFPLTYLWIPFIHDNYGLSGASCWMRALDENCKIVGLADQLIFAYGAYEGVGVAAIFVTIVISVVYCRIARDYPDARQLIKRTLLLLIFLLLYVFVISLPLVVRLDAGITGSRQHFILWITWAVAIPISHTIFTFGFLFSFYSGRMLCSCGQVAKVCRKRFTHLKRRNDRHETQTDKKISAVSDGNKFKPSDRLSPPSQSYFSIPYTDGFTNHSSETCLLVDQLDRDTGYNSNVEISQLT